MASEGVALFKKGRVQMAGLGVLNTGLLAWNHDRVLELRDDKLFYRDATAADDALGEQVSSSGGTAAASRGAPADVGATGSTKVIDFERVTAVELSDAKTSFVVHTADRSYTFDPDYYEPASAVEWFEVLSAVYATRMLYATLNGILAEHGANWLADVMRWLDMGALVHPRLGQNRSESPLYLAAGGEPEAVRLLLERGAPVNVGHVNEDTPLHRACRDGRVENVALLLERSDVNVDSVNRTEGETPLHAVMAFHRRLGPDDRNRCAAVADICTRLVRRGARVEAVDRLGRTPLMLAAAEGLLPVVDILGGNVNLQDVQGRTAGHFAAEQRRRAMLDLLEQRGLNVMLADNSGRRAAF